MKVTSKGDPRKFIEYGEHILTNPDFDSLVVLGSGSSIEVAVKVADQLKQRVPGLHQMIDITSIKVKKQQAVPEELLEEGLE